MTIKARYSIPKLLQESCTFQRASTIFFIHGLALDLGSFVIQEWQVLWSSPSVCEQCMKRDFSNLWGFLIVRINVSDLVPGALFASFILI